MPTPEYRNELIDYYLKIDLYSQQIYDNYEYRNDLIYDEELYNIDDLIELFNHLNI